VGLLPTQTLAKKPVYIPEIKTVSVQLIYFRPALKQTFFEDYVGDHNVTSNETVVLTVGIPRKQYRAMPIFRTRPSLFLGRFSYRSKGGASGGPIEELEFHVTNWQEIPDGEPIIVSVIPGGPRFTPQALAKLEYPKFNRDMIVDDRWKVYYGLVAEGVEDGITVHNGPHAIVTVNGGNISLVASTRKNGWVDLYEFNKGEGLKLEEGESYAVEVIVNDISVFSKVFTRETSDFPDWTLKVEQQEAVFYEINGYIYDTSNLPLADVTLTLDENHTTTTNKKGYYKLSGLFAGTYTLTATKEGYTFAPVKVTGGNGQPVTIDLVEKKPTQCLLYAVHDTAKPEAQLMTVDLAAEELEIIPLGWQPQKPEISIAVGNFDGDEQDEIVTAAQKGHNTITLSEFDGQTIRSFPTSLSGILLATGDLDGDDKPEIVAASRSANHRSVTVYAADGKMLETVELFTKNTRMVPAIGDIDGDGKDDIIAGSLLKEDQVVIYNSATQQRQSFLVFQEPESRLRKKSDSSGKAAPSNKPTFGVQVATGDFNDDGKNEIVVAMASKGSRVEVYNASGTLQSAFTAFESQKGLVVTVGNVVGDSQPEIIVAETKGNLIRAFSVEGEQLFELEAVKSGTVSSMAVFGCLEE